MDPEILTSSSEETTSPTVDTSPATDATVVDLSEPANDTGADAAPADQPRDEHGRWAQKKAERANKFQELSAAKAELEAKLAQQAATYEAKLAELQRSIRPANDAAPPAAPAVNHASEVAKVMKDMQMQLAFASAEGTPAALAQQAMERYWELDQRRIDLLIEQRMAAQKPREAQDSAAYERAVLLAEHPWLNDGAKREQAAAMYQYLVKVEGQPEGLATSRIAAQRVAARLGIGTAPAPTAQQKQLYQGVPQRQAGAKPSRVTFTAEENAMLQASGLKGAELQKLAREIAAEIAKEDPSRLHD